MAAGRYRHRQQAGQVLAQCLADWKGRSDAIVLALPRGGVPVGFAVAEALGLPLDVLVVRKLGLPGHAEYAMGAVGSGLCVLQRDVIAAQGVSPPEVDAVIAREQAEAARRERLYRGRRRPPAIAGKAVLLVDDGLATGATMRCAVAIARRGAAASVAVAVPVGAPAACAALAGEADALVCPLQPENFRAVGMWYQDFDQVSDKQVQQLLALAWQGRQGRRPDPLAAA